MRTNCEQFADRGDAMDAGVPTWFGLTNEPKRAIVRPDGTRELAKEWVWWEELPDARPYAKPAVPNERPDPVRVQASKDARLAFNDRMRARRHYEALTRDASAPSAEFLKPGPDLFAGQHVVQSRDEHIEWLAAERAEIARQRAARAARKA